MRAIAATLVLWLGLAAPGFAQNVETGQPPDVAGLVARPLAGFSLVEPDRKVFGRLEWLGGLQVSDPAQRIGGLSDIRTFDHGRRFLAISDAGFWVSGSLVSGPSGELQGLTSARIDLMKAADVPEQQKDWLDAEGLAIRAEPGGVTAHVSFEEHHRILKFGPVARIEDLPAAIGHPMAAAPEALASLRWTKGLEALAAAPPGHPLGQALIALSEWPPKDGANHLGLIVGGRTPGRFELVRRDDFDVTSAAFLPGGDLLVLERRFTLLRGPGMRLLRIAAADLRPGAVITGDILLTADLTNTIDNMEDLAVDQAEDGATILTVVSDDNFSALQRTLVLRFKLLDLAP